jgi:serine/threonine protein kinase
LLQAVEYLHNNNICHNDIKPENIIYDSNTQKIKLIDFNISQKMGVLNTSQGTKMFMPPQNEGEINHKIDAWGIGVILCFLLT